jgi:hypothetical protein
LGYYRQTLALAIATEIMSCLFATVLNDQDLQGGMVAALDVAFVIAQVHPRVRVDS